MKTTLRWLKDYCDFTDSVEQLTHRLAMAGMLIEDTTPHGDDTALGIEITSNRPDLLGTIGIAREIAALTGGSLRLPPADFPVGREKASDATSVVVEAPDRCPRYTARVIRGVRVGPSPAWLRRRIEAIGLRPVNNVVDVTNYVLFECGQPLHAFDLARLREGRIVVRRPRDGERITTIDGAERRLEPDMLVIADAQRPVAVAGVMGGLDSEIGPATRDVLLESAEFEKTGIRRTARALQMLSDASYRFERGVDPVQVEWASRRAARLIRETAGGEICDGVVDVWAVPYTPQTITLRIARLHHVLGLAVPPDAAARALERLGFEIVRADADAIAVRVPPFRAVDVYREVDLIEEVARIHGYERIPERSTLVAAAGRVSAAERAESALRAALVGMGYYETLTNSFCTESVARLVSPWTDAEPLLVQNTIRRDENRLRVSILPELLRVKQTNAAHGVPASPLFEISRVYLPRPPRASGPAHRDDALPVELPVLAILDDSDLRSLKGAIETLLDALRIPAALQCAAWEHPFFRKGHAARLLLDGHPLGVMGEVDGKLAEQYDLAHAPCLAELDMAPLVAGARLLTEYAPLPAYPASERDLAVVVDESLPWAEIERCVRALDLPHLERIAFFDIFRGKQVPKGKKSLAFSLTFRAPDRTLTREEVEASRQRCIAALAALGAELRA